MPSPVHPPIKHHANILTKVYQNLNELIDDNCDFQAIKQQVKRDKRNHQTILHNNTVPAKANIILQKDTTKSVLATFLHATCFSRSTATFHKAVKNKHFLSWSGLDPQLIQKHLPYSIATAKGHLKRERSHLQSTSKQSSSSPSMITAGLDDLELHRLHSDYFPPPVNAEEKTNQVIYSVLETSSKQGKAYMDLTGKFPVKSARGYQYILIAYHYDSNAILAKPIKNCQAQTIANAWEELHSSFIHVNATPTT